MAIISMVFSFYPIGYHDCCNRCFNEGLSVNLGNIGYKTIISYRLGYKLYEIASDRPIFVHGDKI